MCGNQSVLDRFRNHHCISELDLASNTLTLHVKCSVQNLPNYVGHPPGVVGGVRYRCEPLVGGQNGTLASFKRAFVDAIRKYWHNKLWIEPALPDPSIASIQCGVEVSFVQDPGQAHCQILMLHAPKPAPGQRDIAFKSNCNLGGGSNVGIADMLIGYRLQHNGTADDFNSVHEESTEDRGVQPFTNNVAAHEFGHYLGLNHRCFSPRRPNTRADYCFGRTYELMSNMMGVGTAITGAHGQPWASRLRQHHYHCDRTWVGVTTPTQHHPGLINSLASGGP